MPGLISELPPLEDPPGNGTRRRIGDKECVFYDGYWIRYYPPPEDGLAAKKQLIDQLTRRLFHHTEPGINTPGDRLEAARAAFERETDPRRKRVCGAMLAGALFNRATDIFTSIVDLAGQGRGDESRQRADARVRGMLRGGAGARQDGQAPQRPRGDRRAVGRAAQGVLPVHGGLLREPLPEDRADHAGRRPHRRRDRRPVQGRREVPRTRPPRGRPRPGREAGDGDDAPRTRRSSTYGRSSSPARSGCSNSARPCRSRATRSGSAGSRTACASSARAGTS